MVNAEISILEESTSAQIQTSLEQLLLQQILGLSPKDIVEIDYLQNQLEQDPKRIKKVSYSLNQERMRGVSIFVNLSEPFQTRDEIEEYFRSRLHRKIPITNITQSYFWEGGNTRIPNGYDLRYNGFLFHFRNQANV